mmetsp:Transcript_5848/g.12703  ORF Transcript_5848/g.12703 Transcript_5848/m.12703 type:complete len:229 (+) Transcript_5848:392-1078(+)
MAWPSIFVCFLLLQVLSESKSSPSSLSLSSKNSISYAGVSNKRRRYKRRGSRCPSMFAPIDIAALTERSIGTSIRIRGGSRTARANKLLTDALSILDMEHPSMNVIFDCSSGSDHDHDIDHDNDSVDNDNNTIISSDSISTSTSTSSSESSDCNNKNCIAIRNTRIPSCLTNIPEATLTDDYENFATTFLPRTKTTSTSTTKTMIGNDKNDCDDAVLSIVHHALALTR